ncbi:MAG: peptidoglycan bridge formation glycyltransferase FemA/FemB family protein, partial [Angelakisella sp.]
MEILRREQYREYENFVAGHPRGEFTQSVYWHEIKSNWQFEAVVSRSGDGTIQGACGVLIQKLPLFGTAFMYSPRGPVCDLHDKAVLADLKAGIDSLAKSYNAHSFKMDPDVDVKDSEFLEIMEQMGFHRFYGPDGFETIQARFNYRLPIAGRTEEELLAGFTQKTRYNVRYAQKHGVTIKVEDSTPRADGTSALDDFMRIYRVTGERDGFSIRPKSYMERLLNSLGEHARLYMGYYDGN